MLPNDFLTLTSIAAMYLSARQYKNFKINVVGNTTLYLTKANEGDSGRIILIIDAIGGYTVTFSPTTFTKILGDVLLDVTANAYNFIEWHKVGADIVYEIKTSVL